MYKKAGLRERCVSGSIFVKSGGKSDGSPLLTRLTKLNVMTM